MPTPDKMEQDFFEDDFYDWCSMELLFAWIDLTARGALLLVLSVNSDTLAVHANHGLSISISALLVCTNWSLKRSFEL